MTSRRMTVNVGGKQREYEVLFDSRSPQPNSAIPKDMLPKLIQLCHPDRHGNSALSTEVTRWLLEQRKEHA